MSRMAVFEKVLLRNGIYAAPQGQFEATPERLRHFVSQFQEMRRRGIRVPVAWGHQPKAIPGDDEERAQKQYYLSHFNAGYLDDLDYDEQTGRLKGKPNVPGADCDENGNIVTECTLPDGRKVKSACGEVSIAVKDWKDGKGKLWKDSIIHVAITPLPVVAGQDGFRALSTDNDEFDGWTLSLAQLSPTESRQLSADTEETDMADPKADVTPSDDDSNSDFDAVMKGLAGLGVVLPPDTTPENLLHHLRIGLHVLDNVPKDDDGDRGAGADDDDGTGGGEDGGQVVEEQRPVMMSLASETDPIRQKFLSQRQETHKADLLRRIDRLSKAGLMPANVADGLRRKVDGYELSLTAELDLVPRSVDRTLATWEQAAAHLKGARKAGKVLLGTVGTEAPRPSVDENYSPDEIAKRAARVSQGK